MKLIMIIGKLKVIIKINELPTNVQIKKDNWKIFQLDWDGQVGKLLLRQKKYCFTKTDLSNIVVWKKVDS